MCKPLRILIVEDSFVSAILYKVKIERREPDFEVHLAGTMAEGIEELHRFQPHLVILDLGLPDSPKTVEEQIRLFRPARVLAMSADQSRREEAIQGGADDFLPKVIGENATPFIARILAIAPECAEVVYV